MNELPLVEAAKQLRAELKAAGIKASVRIKRFSLGQEIRVEVKSGELNKATCIANKYESVQREDTGEVLGGGNRFVRVTKWEVSGG